MPLDSRPSLAADLWARLTATDAVTTIRSMVEGEPKAIENEWLEFKAYPWDYFVDPRSGCLPQNLKDPKRDFIKETWSEVLGAFANTQGSVLIWGIHAAKNAEGIDQAEKFIFVPRPEILATRLIELHHESTDPPIPGVEIFPYEDPSETEKGFVACYVPESLYVPHRSRHKGDQFYYRSLDKSVVIPIPMLRRLFYPQTRARFRVEVTLRNELSEPEAQRAYSIQPTNDMWTHIVNRVKSKLCLNVTIKNVGTATAKDAYVVVRVSGGDLNYHPDQDWLPRETPAGVIGYSATRSLHPGTDSLLFRADSQASFTTWHIDKTDWTLIPKFGRFTLHLTFFADNMEPQESVVTFEETEVASPEWKATRSVLTTAVER